MRSTQPKAPYPAQREAVVAAALASGLESESGPASAPLPRSGQGRHLGAGAGAGSCAALLWVLAACNQQTPSEPSAPPVGPGAAAVARPAASAPPAAPTLPPAPQTGAVIAGRALFVGKPPAAAPQPRGSDPFCAGLDLPDDSLVVDASGGLRSVLVRVVEAAGGPYAPPAAPVVVTQAQCRYKPRVVGAVRGQSVLISNSDGTLHNVHALVGGTTVLNQLQLNAEAPRIELRPFSAAAAANNPLQLRCDVHPWMAAYLWVLDHPFFAVTADDGSFSISNVPPGQYTLEAWHERLGTRRTRLTIPTASAAAKAPEKVTEKSPEKPEKLEFRFTLEPAAAPPAAAPVRAPGAPKSAAPPSPGG